MLPLFQQPASSVLSEFPSDRPPLVPDTYIQKTKKLYIDSRARRNLGSINTELQDVQRIMVANIEEVLQRGEALSGTGNSWYLAYGSLSPQSAEWVEHTGGKGLLIPEPPKKSSEVNGCFIWFGCILRHLAGTGASSG